MRMLAQTPPLTDMFVLITHTRILSLLLLSQVRAPHVSPLGSAMFGGMPARAAPLTRNGADGGPAAPSQVGA